ncbi:tyrosine-type recombinase/integrase [Sulfurospirillum sp. 1307]
MKLTQAFVKRAKCEKDKSKQEFHDDELKGFMLEVRANGRKTFYLRIVLHDGKRKSTKLGDATILPTQEARTKALKLKRSLEEGKEVIIDTPPPEFSSMTLLSFYHQYYLPFVQKHVKSWKSNDSMMRVHILPKFGKYKMSEIKKHDIMKAHIEMVQVKKLKPSTANKFLIFLSQAYTIAIEYELEGIANNPASKVKPLEENNARERFVTKREAKRLIKAVNESQNINLKYIIPFLLLTGARRGEVLKAQWKDINLNQNIWTIPTSKNGKKRILPISEKLKELISTIPNHSKYLFPSPKTGIPQNDFYRSWDHARRKAGLKDVRLHDLRHSFASALVNSGRSLYEVQTLLGHSNMKMTQRYAHLSNESLMNAISCAGKLLD